MAARTIGAGFFGAFVGAWLARALFKWILDLEGTLLIVLIVATAVSRRSRVRRRRARGERG